MNVNKYKCWYIKKVILVFFSVVMPAVYSQHAMHKAVTTPISINQLEGYSHYPVAVKNLLNNAFLLSTQHLTYLFGSDNPRNRGMDCSGTIYYLLKAAHIDHPPRSASDLYQWVVAKGRFYSVSRSDTNPSRFPHLKPGDLLFWSGTYSVHRNPPITHVMLYLGKNKMGQPLMFGSSDGRFYQNKLMWGVSMFDFLLPPPGSPGKFEGYGCIPNISC